MLVVEQEASVRALIEGALTTQGFDLLEAEDGDKGVLAVPPPPMPIDGTLCQ
jgi:DNA-binding response OmpR family regulator